MVGASGAISGVMGGYMVLYPRVRVHTVVWLVVFLFRLAVPAWVMIGYWFALQLLSASMEQKVGGVAVWAHIGGFLAGAALVSFFRDRVLIARRAQALAARQWQVVR